MDRTLPFDDQRNLRECIWGKANHASIGLVSLIGGDIRPLIRFRGIPFFRIPSLEGALYYIKEVNLFHAQDFFRYDGFAVMATPIRRARGIRPLGVFRSFHTFSSELLFTPSIAEVLVQIPLDFSKEAAAFEIIEWPRDRRDLIKEKKWVDEGLHVATVRLYSRPRLEDWLGEN